MADSSAMRRMLFMHPAHQSVGVPGEGVALRPYCRIERYPTGDMAAAPLRMAMVACKPNIDAREAMALFERTICERGNVQCRRADLDAVDAWESLADVDGVAVFGRGICIARHWSDIDLVALMADGPRERAAEQIDVEIASSVRWHPVLEGVEPFVSRSGHTACEGIPIPEDATLLLTGRTAGGVQPVAWANICHHGRVFCTTLGSAEDFRQPDFVRLVLNALAWIGR